jgi:lysophospholipase L1-like esterase
VQRHLLAQHLFAAILTTSTVAVVLNGGASSPVAAAMPAGTPLSIVQLGDSIASGEGTLYEATNPEVPNGQLYFCKSLSNPSSDCNPYPFDYYNGYWKNWPSTSPGTWTPSGSPAYPECHQSPDAYGQIVAATYAAKLTQLACTGASFLTGITGSEEFAQGRVTSSAFLSPYTVGAPKVPSGGAASVPAQFGNISATGEPSNLNSAYTSAKPNVVLLTLGADDLKFVDILTACIEWNYNPADSPAQSSRNRSRYSGPLQCSADNDVDKKGPTSSDHPNGVIQDLYTNQLTTLHTHLTNLLTAIEKEGRQPGQSGPPKIVITNYPNPLPNNLPQKSGSSWASDYCPDTFPFYNAQVDYFSGLVDQLNTNMAQWVSSYKKTSEFGANIGFVNVAKLDDGYQWCDDKDGDLSPNSYSLEYREPYAYGFAVNGTTASLASYPSPAIFHPTITGQQQIAACVKPAVANLVSNSASSANSRSVRLLARGQYRVWSTLNGKRILDSC